MLRRQKPWTGNDWSSEMLEHYFHRHFQSASRTSLDESLPDEQQPDYVLTPSCIDQIPAEIVAQAKINNAFKNTTPWAQEILRYLLNDQRKKLPTVATPEKQAEKLERTGAPKSPNVRKEMLEILEWLTKEIGLLERTNLKRATKEQLHAFAVMFAVLKMGKFNADGQQMKRIITDARLANGLTSDNVSFELFTLPALLQCVSNVSHEASRRKTGKWFCVNVDLRHYYHQIPLPHHLRNLFLFKCRNSCFRAVSLPMGWYLSPIIAQALTWSLVLGYEWPSHIGKQEDYKTMPSWIPFKNKEGGIFVLLDNILIITNDEAIAKEWTERLKRNAAPDRLNIAFKDEVKVTTIEQGKPGSFTEFLGINFWFDKWSVKEKEYKNILRRGGSLFSYREISSMLGEILWDLRVRCICPLQYADLMEVYSAVTPPTTEDWDTTRCWKEYLPTLEKFYRTALLRLQRHRLPTWHPDPRLIRCYAVDASGVDPRHRSVPQVQQTALVSMQLHENYRWKKWKHQHAYIGVAELEAILRALQDAIERYPNVTLVIIATDSLCAKGWVERMFCDREDARRILEQINAILNGEITGRAIRVACVYVRSENNISDIPTRDTRDLDGGNALDWKEEKTAAQRIEATEVLLRSVVLRVCSKAILDGQAAVRNRFDQEAEESVSG